MRLCIGIVCMEEHLSHQLKTVALSHVRIGLWTCEHWLWFIYMIIFFLPVDKSKQQQKHKRATSIVITDSGVAAAGRWSMSFKWMGNRLVKLLNIKIIMKFKLKWKRERGEKRNSPCFFLTQSHRIVRFVSQCSAPFDLPSLKPFTTSPRQAAAVPGQLSFRSLNQWFELPRPWWRPSTICYSRRPRRLGGSWAQASSWGPPPCCWTRSSREPSSWLITCSRRTSCKRTPTTSVSMHSHACSLHVVM